jgi:hypothetical protein
MKKNLVRLAAVALFAMTVFSAAGAGAAQSSGSADAKSYLFRLKVGSKTVQLGSDLTSVVRGDKTSAVAKLIAATAGSKSFGAGERSANSTSDSGTTQIAETQPVSVAGLLSLGSIDGSLTTKVTDSLVSSGVDVTLGAANLLTGLARVGASSSETNSSVTSSQASSQRSIDLDGIDVLALGDLLSALGVDPLAMACSAVEQVGAALGIDASQACEQLAAAQGAIDTAQSALDDAKATVESTISTLQSTVGGFDQAQVLEDKDTVVNTVCGSLDLVCQATAVTTVLTPLATTYGVDISALGFDAAKSALVSQFDTLLAAFQQLAAATADLSTVNGAIGDAASGVCSQVVGAVQDVVGGVPSLAGSLAGLAAQVDAACDVLAGTLNGVLDAPLISVDGVKLSIATIARPNDPVAKVSGSVGQVKIGGLAPIAVDLAALSTTIDDVTAALGRVLSTVTNAVGINLPTPDVTLLAKDTDKGKRSDGTWFATGSVSALRIKLPAATLTLPDVDPLGLLGGTVGIAAVQQASPELTLDLGVFESSSEYNAAGSTGSNGDGGTLPTTGQAGPGLLVFLAAGVLAVGAFGLRRWLVADH